MLKFLRALPLLGLLAVPFCASAQQPVPAAEQAALTETVTALDTKLFDAYNHCDLTTLGAMVSDDLEFYHDQTGLMVGKAPFSRRSSRTSAARGSGRWCRDRWRCIG